MKCQLDFFTGKIKFSDLSICHLEPMTKSHHWSCYFVLMGKCHWRNSGVIIVVVQYMPQMLLMLSFFVGILGNIGRVHCLRPMLAYIQMSNRSQGCWSIQVISTNQNWFCLSWIISNSPTYDISISNSNCIIRNCKILQFCKQISFKLYIEPSSLGGGKA